MISLYRAIASRLKAKVPELTYIDWDTNQDDSEQFAYPAPCVLIRIDVDWTGENGTANIALRMLLDMPEDTNEGSGREADADAKLITAEHIHQALRGFSGTHFNGLLRTRTSAEPSTTGVMVLTHFYRCNIKGKDL